MATRRNVPRRIVLLFDTEAVELTQLGVEDVVDTDDGYKNTTNRSIDAEDLPQAAVDKVTALAAALKAWLDINEPA